MRLNFYLMRHAITYFNVKNIYTGHLDIPILDFSPIISSVKYDLVISSDMIRCKQTLDNLMLNSTPIIYDNRLKESGYGFLTGKEKNKKLFKRDIHNRPPYSKYYKSESIYDSGVRAKNCIDSYSKYIYENDYKNILILSHKNTLSGLWYLLNDENTNIPKFKNKSPILIEYEYDLNKFLGG